MIIEIKFKNILSFKEWTILDFKVDKKEEKKFNGWGSMNIGREKLIKVVSLYGANASGKTNLIKVFEILKSIIFSKKESKDEKINIIPFLFDEISKNEPSEFEILFYYKNVKYKYILKVDANQIHYESLEYYPRRKPKMIFERKTENGVSEVKFNPIFNIEGMVKKEIELKCLKNMSVIRAYQEINTRLEIIEPLIKTISNLFVVFLFNFTMKEVEIFKVFSGLIINSKNDILEFMRLADFNLNDMIFENKRLKLSDEREVNISYLKSLTHKIQIEQNKYELKELPFEYESEGTKKMIFLLGLINQLVKFQEENLILIDEIENSIHPLLLKHFIKKLLEMNNNFQVIFTTHYDPLLEWDDIIRKDFVWFTSKREDGSSELYPLTDFKGLNRITSLKKAYNYGNFGAIPNIED
jgi:AAA15 family ATPase/GTPase